MYTKELKQLVDQLDQEILDAEEHLTALGADGVMIYVDGDDIHPLIHSHLSDVQAVMLGFDDGSILMFVERIGTTESFGEPIIDLPIAVRTALVGHIPRLLEMANELAAASIQGVLDSLHDALEVEDCCSES